MSAPSMRAPWWFWVVLGVLVVPSIFLGGAFAKLDAANADLFAWLYPLYMFGAAACAVACYAERRTLAWILVGVMALSDAGMYTVAYL